MKGIFFYSFTPFPILHCQLLHKNQFPPPGEGAIDTCELLLSPITQPIQTFFCPRTHLNGLKMNNFK
jgi:hypothetical protein